MRKLYIICGHGDGDPGAGGYGYTEAERVRALGRRIKELGGDNVVLLDPNKNWYKTAGINSLNVPRDAGIAELHMDSGVSSAHGGHVIIKNGYSPDEQDRSLESLMKRIFPGRSSTIVGRSDLANVNRAASRGINYRLIENGFISNRDDLNKFNSRIDEIAKGYLDAFGIPYAKPQPKPKPFVHTSKRPTGTEPFPNASDVYRLYNPSSGQHLFTTSTTERDGLTKIGWRVEGTPFRSEPEGNRVYRMYNPNSGDHHFTVDLNEAQSLWDLNWEFEGVPFISNGNVGVQRLYNPANGQHMFTADPNEIKNLVANGWKNEGIGWTAVEV